MSASTVRAPVAFVPTDPWRKVRVAHAIGWVEARKLTRHPATAVGAFLYTAAIAVGTWREVPVLNRFDGLTSEALIPFGCAVLLAAQFATMRARRHRSTELFVSFVSSESTVTAAHLIAVAYASAVALCLALAGLAYMKMIGGATAPRPAVVLIGPALVAFGGAFGVALGRWAPKRFAAPVGLACIVAACTAVTTNSYTHNREWLSLWVPSEFLTGIAGETSLRPYGWRLLYIIALALVAAAVAFAHRNAQRPLALGLALVAVAGSACAGRMQMRPFTRSEQVAFVDALIDELRDPSCREHGSVRYCPMPGYGNWVERWREPVEGVLASAPEVSRSADLQIVQLPSQAHVYDDGRNDEVERRLRKATRSGPLSPRDATRVSVLWGRNGAEGTFELALALSVSDRLTGIDTHFRLRKGDIEGVRNLRRHGYRLGAVTGTCSTQEQGRSVIALWLAAEATRGAELALRRAASEAAYHAERSDDPDGFFSPGQWALDLYMWDALGRNRTIWGTRETAYALQLLERDETSVRTAVAAGWSRLTDPKTTTDEAAALLGLEPLPPLETAIENWGLFKQYRGIGQLGSPQCH